MAGMTQKIALKALSRDLCKPADEVGIFYRKNTNRFPHQGFLV